MGGDQGTAMFVVFAEVGFLVWIGVMYFLGLGALQSFAVACLVTSLGPVAVLLKALANDSSNE